MHSIDRRQFLGGSLCALGASVLKPGVFSAGSSDEILVVLQLAGGNDGLATVTPKEDDLYYRARPKLGIPKKRLLPLNSLNGFHPALRKIARRFQNGQVCIHQGIGQPSGNLSHFRSQDMWHTASVESQLPPTGWIGRAESAIGSGPVPIVAAGSTRMPLAVQGPEHSACLVESLDEFRIRSRAAEKAHGVDQAKLHAISALQSTPSDGPLGELREAWDVAQASITELAKANRFSGTSRFGGSALGRDLELVARAIGAGLDTRCFYVTHGGYDTHAMQLPAHAKQLSQLDRAVDGFLSELKRQGNLERTLLLTVSEFGRRVAESGIARSVGTDHGAANCLMAFGGNVNAGLHGNQPNLERLDTNGNLIYRTDFRRVYADVLENWLGVESQRVLGARFEPLPIVRRA